MVLYLERDAEEKLPDCVIEVSNNRRFSLDSEYLSLC